MLWLQGKNFPMQVPLKPPVKKQLECLQKTMKVYETGLETESPKMIQDTPSPVS